VAIRKLRAGFTLFSRALFRSDAQARELRAQLRDAARALAPARERHVLRRRLAQAQGLDEAALARLSEAEDEATAAARAALAAKGFQSMLLRLAHWLETGGWLNRPEGALPLPPLAAKLLDRQRERIKGMRRRLAGMSDSALHDLRLEVKKMRYAAEYFAPLSPDPAQACAHGEALAQVQDALGDMQDLAQAEAVLAQAFGQRLDHDDVLLTKSLLAALQSQVPPRQDLITRTRRHLTIEKAKAGWWRALNQGDL
jgi:triphosphatase